MKLKLKKPTIQSSDSKQNCLQTMNVAVASEFHKVWFLPLAFTCLAVWFVFTLFYFTIIRVQKRVKT